MSTDEAPSFDGHRFGQHRHTDSTTVTRGPQILIQTFKQIQIDCHIFFFGFSSLLFFFFFLVCLNPFYSTLTGHLTEGNPTIDLRPCQVFCAFPRPHLNVLHTSTFGTSSCRENKIVRVRVYRLHACYTIKGLIASRTAPML
jgi:hypothetical protein